MTVEQSFPAGLVEVTRYDLVLPLFQKRLTPHWSFSFFFLETHPELYDYTGVGKKQENLFLCFASEFISLFDFCSAALYFIRP